MPTQPDTPRTDAEEAYPWQYIGDTRVVSAFFARQLERETIAQAEEIRRLKLSQVIAAEALLIAHVWRLVWADKFKPDSVKQFDAKENEFLDSARALLNPPTKEK